MEKELQVLTRALKEGRIITLILGLRRLGKTSLLRAVLNSLEKPSIMFDVRTFEGLRHVSGGGWQSY